MGKALAILAALSAAVVAVLAVIASGLTYVLPPVLALGAGVMLLLRPGTSRIAGIALIVLALAAMFVLLGSINIKGTTVGSDQSGDTAGWAAGATVGLLASAALLALYWARIQPMWLAAVGAVGVVGGVVAIWILHAGLGDYQAGGNWLIAVLALAAAAPAVMVAREPDPAA